jgi:FkbM family methyltransferase
MTFVSYAQNFEDVMLWRALRHVGAGLYVDVGAQHPLIDSVSKAFHEQGWRGVHIEPVPRFADMLRAQRPGDTVLQVALSDHDGTLALNVIADTGLSTAVDRYAERHRSERGYANQRLEVPALTLASALRSLNGQEVHWLKIDVEGFEGAVLRGWDSAVLRPWIMVVEATVPNSTEPDYAMWDPILRQAGYRFVYFDGLNRFYIAQEHPELAAAFAAPPNVFDDVEVSGHGSWRLYRRVQDSANAVRCLAAQQLSSAVRQATLARGDFAALSARADALQNALDDAHQQAHRQADQVHHWWSMADDLSRELAALRGSLGWRTVCLARALMRGVRWPVQLMRRIARRLWRPDAGAISLEVAQPVTERGNAGLSQQAARHYLQLSRALQARKN